MDEFEQLMRSLVVERFAPRKPQSEPATTRDELVAALDSERPKVRQLRHRVTPRSTTTKREARS